jgi:hypothetical protein
MKLGSYPMILGRSWLWQHSPDIDWKNNTASFKSGYCQAHYLSTCPSIPTLPVNISLSNNPYNIAMISATDYENPIKQNLYTHNLHIR